MIYPLPTRTSTPAITSSSKLGYIPTKISLSSSSSFGTLQQNNTSTTMMDDDSDEHSILSAAHVLMSLGPSLSSHNNGMNDKHNIFVQQQQQQQQRPQALSPSPPPTTVPFLYPYGTTTTNNNSVVDYPMKTNINTFTTSTTPMDTTTTTIQRYDITPNSTYTIQSISGNNEFPKILSVPQRSTRGGINSTDGENDAASFASSLHDGFDDDHSHTSSSTTSTSSSTSSSESSSSAQLPQEQQETKVNLQYRHNDNTTTTISSPKPSIASPHGSGPIVPIIIPPVDRNSNTNNNTTNLLKLKIKNLSNTMNRKKHKNTMKISSLAPKQQEHQVQGNSSPKQSNVGVVVVSKPSTLAATPTTPTYYEGSISLRLKEDELSLSPLHCFMRQYCVEAFTASSEEVTTPRYGKSHGRSISIGQVGIQCVFCKNRPYWLRQERAVCFPSTLKNIYHSIETWQRRHSIVCTDIPTWAKDSMAKLMGKSRSGAGGRRQYWEESAIQLGMVDTPAGIRFICPPGSMVVSKEKHSNVAASSNSTVCTEATFMSTNTTSLEGLNSTSSTKLVEMIDPSVPAIVGGKPVVDEDDKELVTDFLFTLLNQMETCYFSEQDRVGGRSKVKDCPIGYPGLQCKHCGGKAGFGRYYPISLQALTSANSDRNIYNHVDKCRRCPSQIRNMLQQHLTEQNIAKNRRGNRKEFFQRIWERMHGPTPAVTSTAELEETDISSSTETSIERNQKPKSYTKMDVDEKKESSNTSFVKHIIYKQQPQYWQQSTNIISGPIVDPKRDNSIHPQQQQRQPNHLSIVQTQYNNITPQVVTASRQSQQQSVVPSQQFDPLYQQHIFQIVHQRIQDHPELYHPHARQMQQYQFHHPSMQLAVRNDTNAQPPPNVITSSSSSVSYPSFYHQQQHR